MEKFKFEEDDQIGKFDLFEDETKIGEVTYRKRIQNAISINHTYVKKEFEGKGYGKKLVDKVLEFAKENDLSVSATCWFAEKVIQSYE
ncbi:GNAT family N-acetyltransferase [Moheibacter lacus]|uniref:N-acetyltransferase n=1 Tax=Moheibacter lacus TaxID=2745851 RepID=A0A838ZLH0_9FLAO|nr:GNAT family N-acetyltransferase [Moheibacter lacus]MBA5629324.1 N-acetyltransferase [Moheibacter lacus]